MKQQTAKKGKWPSADTWAKMINRFVKRANRAGKPVIIGDTILAYPSEADDPTGGMHEFDNQAYEEWDFQKVKKLRCIHCGKTQEELLEK